MKRLRRKYATDWQPASDVAEEYKSSQNFQDGHPEQIQVIVDILTEEEHQAGVNAMCA